LVAEALGERSGKFMARAKPGGVRNIGGKKPVCRKLSVRRGKRNGKRKFASLKEWPSAKKGGGVSPLEEKFLEGCHRKGKGVAKKRGKKGQPAEGIIIELGGASNG